MFDTASTTDLFLRIFGLYFLAAGVGFVLHPATMSRLKEELADSAMLRFMAAFLAFLSGVVILAVHQPQAGWESTVVTLFGWLSFLKGVLLFVAPGLPLAAMGGIGKRANGMRLYAVIIAILGAGLLYAGLTV